MAIIPLNKKKKNRRCSMPESQDGSRNWKKNQKQLQGEQNRNQRDWRAE